MARIVGIRHRIKWTAEGEARPTQLCLLEQGKKPITYNLDNESAELDWVMGRFPTAWRLATLTDDLTQVAEHHQLWRKVRKNENPEELAQNHRVKNEKKKEGQKDKWVILEVPESYDGLQTGDTIAMSLGGSGNRLAYALSRRADEMGGGTQVLRIQPALLKAFREGIDREKDEDALTLAELARDEPTKFFPTTQRDRDLITLIEAYRARIEAMKARIGCEQRLRQLFIGRVFCTSEGKYPEGSIEIIYDEERANNTIYQALTAEEGARERELVRLVSEMDVFQRLFTTIEGVGPMIASRLITCIGDVRRFARAAKLKAFLGVHVMRGGRFGDMPTEKQFPRRRSGLVANWHPDGRQALYLVVDQFNRRPDSVWGRRLLAIKARLRVAHPTPIQVQVLDDKGRPKINKKTGQPIMVTRYNDGHIHKMGLWRTATRFVEWLWREWTRLELGISQPGPTASSAALPEPKAEEPTVEETSPEEIDSGSAAEGSDLSASLNAN